MAASLFGLGLLWTGLAVRGDEPVLPPVPEPVSFIAPVAAAAKETGAPAAKKGDPDKLPDNTVAQSPPAVKTSAFRKQAAFSLSSVYIPPPPPPIPHVHALRQVAEAPAVIQPLAVARAETAPRPAVQQLGAPECLDPPPAVPAAHKKAALVLPDLGPRTSAPTIQLCLQEDERPPINRLDQPMRSSQEVEPGYRIQLEPPGKDQVFQLEGEEALKERMRQEARQRPTHERIDFPDEAPVSKETYAPRSFPPATEVAEPHYVCHKRLLFEEINSERYGWDLGFIQPVVSAAAFYADVVTAPYHWATEPCRKYECSSGYCLPGDPVPYLLYPPEISLTGSVSEAATIVALFAIFPG
ncbi:MAG TPA: hypothetical protein VG013_04070 [Gemmataceae bacterium]|jgi:hypothetical protein|nr:hypothetical protein [Gemmataceae bacterium]